MLLPVMKAANNIAITNSPNVEHTHNKQILLITIFSFLFVSAGGFIFSWSLPCYHRDSCMQQHFKVTCIYKSVT